MVRKQHPVIQSVSKVRLGLSSRFCLFCFRHSNKREWVSRAELDNVRLSDMLRMNHLAKELPFLNCQCERIGLSREELIPPRCPQRLHLCRRRNGATMLDTQRNKDNRECISTIYLLIKLLMDVQMLSSLAQKYSWNVGHIMWTRNQRPSQNKGFSGYMFTPTTPFQTLLEF